MDQAALYLRLSKEDIGKSDVHEESESIINQRLLLTEYAIEHDIQIVAVYSDDDYSGLYDDRPAFDQLLHDAKLGKFNIVISKSQSRFTRNMEHVEKYLHHDFPLMGIRFIGVVDGVDTQNISNKKTRQINGLVNEWYCEDLSNNIRSVFRQKMRDGKYIGPFAPYGYLRDPNDKYSFIIDEYAAGVVRKIYDLYLEGYSIKAICHELEDQKIKNPSLYKESIGLAYRNKKAQEYGINYNLWSPTTVKRILANDTYIGKLNQGTLKKISYKDKKLIAVPKDKWYVTEHHHDAIIDEDTFAKVGALRKLRRRCATAENIDDVPISNKKIEKKVHMFAGKLRCETCGHTMIKSGGVKGNVNDWYLRCQLANKSRNKECTSHNIKYSVVEEKVRIRLQQLLQLALENRENRFELEKIVNNINSSGEEKEAQNQLEMINRKIENLTTAWKDLYLDHADNQVSEEIFYHIKNDFEAELQNLQEKRKELENSISQQKIKLNVVQDHANQNKIQEYIDNIKLDFDMVNELIEYIEIGEYVKESCEQEIIIHWNF